MISMSNATPPSATTRPKLPELGQHVCIVRNMKVHSGHKGTFFILEFEVESGPSPKGTIGDWAIAPKNARASGRMTQKMAEEKDNGKVQCAVAAVFGYGTDQQAMIDDATFQAAVAQTPESCMKGARFIVNNVYHKVTKGEHAGKETSFYDFYPHLEGNGIEFKPRQGGAPAAPAKPKGPPAVPTKPSFEAAAKAAGYEVHPDDASYYYNDDGVLTVDDLKAKLGY
jgi:hypothetical protein